MKSFYKIYILAIVLFSDFALLAQPGSDDGGGSLEGNDAPAAPINGKLIWLGIIGLLLLFITFPKKEKLLNILKTPIRGFFMFIFI
jgi:hypothetical protein